MEIIVVQPDRKTIMVTPGSSYSLEYLKNDIVTAAEHTLGIMVFKNFESADNFCGYYIYKTSMILKVIGIGDYTVPVFISKYLSDNSMTKFYLNKARYNEFNFNPPEGTECYRSVKVLE